MTKFYLYGIFLPMKLKYIIILSIAIAFLSPSCIVFAQDSGASSSTTVVAPEGLTEREAHQLEQGYRYTYRDKQAILSPTYSGMSAAGGPGTMWPEEGEMREQTEQEKLYRYFGIAMSLADENRYDEAIEILKFISERKPHDQYVKSTLKRVMSDAKRYKSQWNVQMKKGADSLKKNKIKDMMADGTAYYEQKRYDMALLKFSDILSIDPANKKAQNYMDKLKKYYLQEVKAERIVRKYEAGEPGEAPQKELEMKGAAENMLNRQEAVNAGAPLSKKAKAAPGEINAARAAQALLDKKEMENVVEKKRVDAMLDQAELGQTVQDIVDARKDEQRREAELAIGGGDIINVIVRDHPELSGRTLVTYGGEAMLPLVNDPVMVKGLTPEQASEKVTEIMKRYIKDPFVTVVIDEYRSKMFYVIDDIGCTPYPITRPNMTIRDALFLADWGTNRALGRVILMKPNKTHPIVKKVDAFDIIYRGNLSGNIRIDDGDVIYAPMTIVGKTTQTVNDTVAPFQSLQNARNLWLQAKWTQKGLKSTFRIYPDSQNLPQVVGAGQ